MKYTHSRLETKNPVFRLSFVAITVLLFVYFTLIPLFARVNLDSLQAGLVGFAGLSALCCGAMMTNRLRFRSSEANNRAYLPLFALFVLVDIYSLFTLFFSARDLVTYSDSFGRLDYTSLYLMIPSYFLYATKYYVFALCIWDDRRLFWFCALLESGIAFFAQTRMVLIGTLVIFGVFGYYSGILKMRLLHLAGALLAAPFLFSLLLIKRGVVGTLTLVRLVERVFAIADTSSIASNLIMAMESFESFAVFTRIVGDRLVLVPNGVMRIFSSFIPRSAWVDKPEALSREIAKRYNMASYASGGGAFATLWGDFFLNGGLIAVVVLSLAVGMVGNLIFSNMRKDKEPLSIMLYALFISEYLNYFRGWFSDSVWKLFVIFAAFAAVRTLLRIQVRPHPFPRC